MLRIIYPRDYDVCLPPWDWLLAPSFDYIYFIDFSIEERMVREITIWKMSVEKKSLSGAMRSPGQDWTVKAQIGGKHAIWWVLPIHILYNVNNSVSKQCRSWSDCIDATDQHLGCPHKRIMERIHSIDFLLFFMPVWKTGHIILRGLASIFQSVKFLVSS